MTAKEYWNFKTMSSDGMTVDDICAFADDYASSIWQIASEYREACYRVMEERDEALKIIKALGK